MLSSSIQDEHFKDYPPEARQIATSHIELLRKLPTAFTPLLLQQIQAYDWRFPAERRDIDQQLAFLQSLSDVQRRQLLSGFERLELPARLANANWASSPGEFSEQLSGYLWSSNQIGTFHEASANYLKNLAAAASNQPLAAPRLGIAVIGKGVEHNTYPLFRRFRPSGSPLHECQPGEGNRDFAGSRENEGRCPSCAFRSLVHRRRRYGRAAEFLRLQHFVHGSEPSRRALLRKIDRRFTTGSRGRNRSLPCSTKCGRKRSR